MFLFFIGGIISYCRGVPKSKDVTRHCEEGALPDEAISTTALEIASPFGLAMTMLYVSEVGHFPYGLYLFRISGKKYSSKNASVS
jgi:hypothetical protein